MRLRSEGSLIPTGVLRCKECANLCGFGRDGQTQGPTERTTTLREVKAPHTGVQPRSPTGEEAPRIGNENPVDSDDAEQ